MSLTLHLGVLVQPYRAAPNKPRRGAGARMSALTTADVAGFLEQNYKLMETFYRVHEQDIAGALERSLEGSLESLLIGRIRVDPWGAATQKIETMFRDFIATKEAERVGIPGTPTKASGGTPDRVGGVNHRLLHPYSKRNPRRPSFKDSGLYLASFKCWTSSK
jgi:hypothetical protein